MEEKDRYYCLIDFELRDYESNKDIHSLYELDDLLNQQDKEIKYLQKLNTEIIMQNKNLIKDAEIINQENQQLKQTHKQLIINVLENIMSLCRNGISNYYSLNYVCTIIEDKIKKLKGE